jgi:hypothetical protein
LDDVVGLVVGEMWLYTTVSVGTGRGGGTGVVGFLTCWLKGRLKSDDLVLFNF